MASGRVNANDEPLISIEIYLKLKLQKFTAIIDTGFNGSLSVPESLIENAGWKELGVEEYELASGERMTARVFSGRVRFDGEQKDIPVLSTKSGDILIGTKLLRNKKLVVNFRKKSVRVSNT